MCDGIEVSGNGEIHKVIPALVTLTTELISCHTPGASNLEVAAGILES